MRGGESIDGHQWTSEHDWVQSNINILEQIYDISSLYPFPQPLENL